MASRDSSPKIEILPIYGSPHYVDGDIVLSTEPFCSFTE